MLCRRRLSVLLVACLLQRPFSVGIVWLRYFTPRVGRRVHHVVKSRIIKSFVAG